MSTPDSRTLHRSLATVSVNESFVVYQSKLVGVWMEYASFNVTVTSSVNMLAFFSMFVRWRVSATCEKKKKKSYIRLTTSYVGDESPT